MYDLDDIEKDDDIKDELPDFMKKEDEPAEPAEPAGEEPPDTSGDDEGNK